MEFRIVKTKARPEHSYPGKYRNVDWFIVQYRDNPSIWNFWRPKWKYLKYNQEEFLEYNSITEPKIWSISMTGGAWANGSLIPTYELALQLLDMFKYQHNFIGEGHEEIVYQSKVTKETTLANKLASEYDYLVNGGPDEEIKSNPINSELNEYMNPPTRKKRKKKSND